jgi:hypothetical protein
MQKVLDRWGRFELFRRLAASILQIADGFFFSRMMIMLPVSAVKVICTAAFFFVALVGEVII